MNAIDQHWENWMKRHIRNFESSHEESLDVLTSASEPEVFQRKSITFEHTEEELEPAVTSRSTSTKNPKK
jgi:hypothetical protein